MRSQVVLEESFSSAPAIGRGARTPCSDGDSDSSEDESQFQKSDLEHLGFGHLSSRYKLLRLVGQGSYGAVALAEDTLDSHAAGAVETATGADAPGPGAGDASPTAHPAARRAVKHVTRIFDSFEHAKRWVPSPLSCGLYASRAAARSCI